MRKLIYLMALALAVTGSTAAFAQSAAHARSLSFASDFQTIPVVANLPGIGGTFQSYVSIFNPTRSAYSITASFYDNNGTKSTALIPIAAGELKIYTNFLDAVFTKTGGGTVTLSSPDSAGGQRNNRFVVNSEVRTSGARYGTSVPALEFAGTSSRSFAPGITVDSNSRTNVGCFNQSSSANKVTVTIHDSTGAQTLGTFDLNLAANGWGQTSVSTIVTSGYAQFDPQDNAVCYAVVVDNGTNDGRFVSAAEYQP